MDLTLDVDTENNFVTICGENNTGKTNILRAIELFFCPEKYIVRNDVPYHKFYGSRGGAVYPEIEIDFRKDNGEVYRLKRKFGLENAKITGNKLKSHRGDNTKILDETEIKGLINQLILCLP